MNRIAIVASVLFSVSALAVVVLRPSPAGDHALPAASGNGAPVARAVAGGDDDGEDAESRVVALERTVASLTRRVTTLENGRVAAGTRPGNALPSDDLTTLRSDVDALLAGNALDTEAGQKRFKQLVRTAQDELFAERMQEHQTEHDRERADRLTKLAEEARLSAQQTQDLTRLLDDEREQRRALRDQVQAGERPRREVFAEFQALGQKTDDGARKLLDDEQYTKYQEMRQSDRPRGPGGGRGGTR